MSSLIDSFTGTDGDAPDTDNWSKVGDCDDLSIQNNALDFNSNEAVDVVASVYSEFTVSGDFDIRVDFARISSTTPTSGYHNIFLGVMMTGGVFVYIYWQHNNNGYNRYILYDSGSSWVTYTTSDTSGKLRIDRSGSTIKVYYWRAALSRWEFAGLIGGRTSAVSSTADVTVRLSFNQEANFACHFTFDNFEVYTGTVFFPGLGLDDLQTALRLIGQSLDDMPTSTHLSYQAMDDMGVAVNLWGEALEDIGTRTAILAREIEDVALRAGLSYGGLANLATALRLTDGTVLANLATALRLTDGTVADNLATRIALVKQAPAFQAVIAQRLRSVKHA